MRRSAWSATSLVRASGVPEGSTTGEMHLALMYAYARFAFENTAYFRVKFELPGVPNLAKRLPEHTGIAVADERPFAFGVAFLKRAIQEGTYGIPCGAEQGAMIGWGVVHGLVTLYLSGHFGAAVPDHESFRRLLESGQQSLDHGWHRREAGGGG